MRRKIRILSISSSANGGGPSHIFLLKELLKDDFDFFLAMPKISKKIKDIEFTKFIEISERKVLFKDLYNLIKFAKKNSVDIIHAHGKGAGLIGRIIKLFLMKPLIYTFHGIHIDCLNKFEKFIYKLYENITGWIDDEKVFVSFSELNQAKKINIFIGKTFSVINNSSKKMPLIHKNTKNDNFKIGIPNTKKNIISLCRLVDQKNIYEIFNIAKNLNNYNFIVLGDGYLYKKAKYFLKIKKIENVFLLGNKKDIFKYLEESDLFLSTSLYEGHPISILEAMSIGMPIVASKVTGNIDTIKNNHSGYLYELGDIKQASKFIKDIIENEKLKLKFSNNAYKRHRELFSTQKMKNSYISLYNKFK